MNIFKKISLCAAAIISMVVTVHAEGVGIADTEITPDPSAILDVQSTNQGALFPRMTSAQRLAISSPATGLLVYDTDEDLFFYKNETEWIGLESNSGSPVGEVTAFAGSTNTIPDGWLLCDGTPLNSTNYPALHAAIGSAWGDASDDGDSSSDFRLPDLRGRFLRGVSGSTTHDLDSNLRQVSGVGGNSGNDVGSHQEDAIRNITGSFNGGPTYASPNANGAFTEHEASYQTQPGSGRTQKHTTVILNAYRVVPTGSDNRPKNVYVNYIIKY